MKSLSHLYQQAAADFLRGHSYESAIMAELTALFKAIAQGLFAQGDFIWSGYNRSQWHKFVQALPSAGGASAFSLHSDGEYQPGRPFQGLYLCNTSGRFPFHTMPLGDAKPRSSVGAIVRSLGYASDGTD